MWRQIHVKRMLGHLQTELKSELRLTAQARRAMAKMATDPNVPLDKFLKGVVGLGALHRGVEVS